MVTYIFGYIVVGLEKGWVTVFVVGDIVGFAQVLANVGVGIFVDLEEVLVIGVVAGLMVVLPIDDVAKGHLGWKTRS